jgi:hypothetical protein
MFQRKISFPPFVSIHLPPGVIQEAASEMNVRLDSQEIVHLEKECDRLFEACPNEQECNYSSSGHKEREDFSLSNSY